MTRDGLEFDHGGSSTDSLAGEKMPIEDERILMNLSTRTSLIRSLTFSFITVIIWCRVGTKRMIITKGRLGHNSVLLVTKIVNTSEEKA